MAIQKLRDGTEGLLAKIIVGLIIIVFGLFGFGSITTFLAPVPKVATVNGEEVSQQDMEIAVERSRRLLIAQNVPQQDIDEDSLREDVLDSLITREVLKQAASDMDLYFGDAALDEEIVATPVFQVNGQFDAQQFQMVIGGAGYSPMMYRDEMRTDKLFQQMVTGITASQFVTKAEVKRLTELSQQTRDFAFLRVVVADLFDNIEVTDEDIEDYYNDNPRDFVTEETVVLEYIDLTLAALAAEVDVTEDDLISEYESVKSQYSVDEQRKVSHILVEVSDDVTEEEARAEIDEIYNEIVEGGDFVALATERSDDPGSAANGGDLGFSGPGTFVEAFEAVAYDLGLNEVSKPVLTEFGYHIIKVTGIEEASTPAFEEIRAEIEQGYRNKIAEEEFVSLSARLGELAFEHVDLVIPAEELGLTVETSPPLTRNALVGLTSNPAVSDAAFGPDVLIDGNNSDVVELTEERHMVLRVKAHTPSASQELELVKEDIRYILQNLRAREAAEEKAVDIVADILEGSLAQFVADQYDLEWVPVPGATRTRTPEVEQYIINEAFDMPRPREGKESISYVVMPNGDAAVIRVSGVNYPSTEDLGDDELIALSGALSTQLGSIDFSEYQAARTEAAQVERE